MKLKFLSNEFERDEVFSRLESTREKLYDELPEGFEQVSSRKAQRIAKATDKSLANWLMAYRTFKSIGIMMKIFTIILLGVVILALFAKRIFGFELATNEAADIILFNFAVVCMAVWFVFGIVAMLLEKGILERMALLWILDEEFDALSEEIGRTVIEGFILMSSTMFAAMPDDTEMTL